MASQWTFKHDAIAVAGIRNASEVTALSTPQSASQWAADLASLIRLDAAARCQRIPGRIANMSFNAILDSGGSLTITMVVT